MIENEKLLRLMKKQKEEAEEEARQKQSRFAEAVRGKNRYIEKLQDRVEDLKDNQ